MEFARRIRNILEQARSRLTSIGIPVCRVSGILSPRITGVAVIFQPEDLDTFVTPHNLIDMWTIFACQFVVIKYKIKTSQEHNSV